MLCHVLQILMSAPFSNSVCMGHVKTFLACSAASVTKAMSWTNQEATAQVYMLLHNYLNAYTISV